MRTNRSKRLALLVFITLIVCASFSLIAWEIVRVKQADVDAINKQVKDKRMMRLRIAHAKTASTQVDPKQIQQLPMQQQLDTYMLNVGRIEQQTGATISLMTFSEGAQEEGTRVPTFAVQRLKRFDFKCTLTADTKAQLLSFLDQLENQPRLTIVHTVSFSRPADVMLESIEPYMAEITFSTFYME
jgi:hypothetical protein